MQNRIKTPSENDTPFWVSAPSDQKADQELNYDNKLRSLRLKVPSFPGPQTLWSETV